VAGSCRRSHVSGHSFTFILKTPPARLAAQGRRRDKGAAQKREGWRHADSCDRQQNFATSTRRGRPSEIEGTARSMGIRS
jgi:ribosomal protein L11